MEINIVVSILFIISFLIIIVGFLMTPDFNSFSEAIVGSFDLRLFSQTKE